MNEHRYLNKPGEGDRIRFNQTRNGLTYSAILVAVATVSAQNTIVNHDYDTSREDFS